MTVSTEHPSVALYLQEFDSLTGSAPGTRHLVLREEIAEHLRDAIPASASIEEAAAVIKRFGSPGEILGAEGAVLSPNRARRRPTSRLLWVFVIVALALVAPVVFALLFLVYTDSTESGRGPVVTTVNGPERVQEGRAFFEYQAEIERMEHPLPAGAEYPLGVPEGLDGGPTVDGDGVMQTGAGANVAHFTWLCAWESEYLAAYKVGDDERIVAAEAMITSWGSSDFYLRMGDTEGGWVTNVVEPLRLGDPTGVKQDLPNTCANAGIFNANG